MKVRTETVCEGEYLGPVNWDYNFNSHSINKEWNEKAIERLKKLNEKPERYEATTDGGWPRVGWGKVLKVGMYDGWPYWRPVPSVLIMGTLGPEWHSYHSISSIREVV